MHDCLEGFRREPYADHRQQELLELVTACLAGAQGGRRRVRRAVGSRSTVRRRRPRSCAIRRAARCRASSTARWWSGTRWRSARLRTSATRRGSLWPADVEARAHARAVTAEMHSGFAALRTHMPMDIRSSRHDTGAVAAKRADVVRRHRAHPGDLERLPGAQRRARCCSADSRSPMRSLRRSSRASAPTA